MTRLSHTLRALLVLLVLGGLASEAHAQAESRSAALVGLAGGGPAAVRDNASIAYNPANLVLDGGPRIVLTLADLSGFAGGDLLQYSTYDQYLAQGRALSDADVSDMLDAWFGAGSDRTLRGVGATAEAMPFALTVVRPGWAVGVALRARMFSSVETSRGLFDLALRGTAADRELPIDGRQRLMGVAELSTAYSRRINDRLSVGVAPKLIVGTHYASADWTSTATVSDGALDYTFDYAVRSAGPLSEAVDGVRVFDGIEMGLESPFSGIAGLGAGIDLGATYALRSDVRLSASLTDAGTVRWSQHAQTVTPVGSRFHFSGLEFDMDRLDAEFDGDLGAYAESVVDSLARDAFQETTRAEGGFSAALPAQLHLGSAWTPRAWARITGGMALPLNTAPGNLGRKPSLHAGGEVWAGPVAFRTGVRVAGGGALTLAGGLGLHFGPHRFDLGIAVAPHSEFAGKGARYAISLSVFNFTF